MLTPPDGLTEDVLVPLLERGWQVTVNSIAYRAVGFGSYHWEVTDAAGTRWFVTADELHDKRPSRGEPLDAAFGRLRASLSVARALHDDGCAFVVAPVPALDGSSRWAAPSQPGMSSRTANHIRATPCWPLTDGCSLTGIPP